MVKVNGEMLEAEGKSVAQILEELQYGGQRVAVELNESIVPKDKYGETVLVDGDTVEVVRFVGGG